jgi:hypothetical protein
MTVDDTTKERYKGKRMRWINDTADGRVQRAEDGGYGFVTADGTERIGEGQNGNSDLGSRISRIVGTKEDGTPLRAYLMAIDEEYYQEDQAAKQKEVDEIDAQIRSGSVGNTKPGQDGRYVKDISYKP